jgi:hypothetical protein
MPDPQFGTLYQILEGDGSQYSTLLEPVGIALPILEMLYVNPGGLSAMPTNLNLDSIEISNHGNWNGQIKFTGTTLPYTEHVEVEAASPVSRLEDMLLNDSTTSNLGMISPTEGSYIGGVTFATPISGQYEGGASRLDDLTPPMPWTDWISNNQPI